MKAEVLSRASFADIAEHGGHWCAWCIRYVTPEWSDVGLPVRCATCGSFRVRFDPPVPGYHREVVA